MAVQQNVTTIQDKDNSEYVKGIVRAIKDNESDSQVTASEIEDAIEMLHGDIRSMLRQIKQRRLKIEVDESLGKNVSDERENNINWLYKVEKVIESKFDQIRMLERTLGDIRNGSINEFSRSHLHVRILKQIVIAVDDSITNMEDSNINTFLADDVEKIKKLIDDLDVIWPELFN